MNYKLFFVIIFILLILYGCTPNTNLNNTEKAFCFDACKGANISKYKPNLDSNKNYTCLCYNPKIKLLYNKEFNTSTIID